MFAIGLVLMFVGWLILNGQGLHFQMTKADVVGSMAFLLGGILSLASICVWAWQHMP